MVPPPRMAHAAVVVPLDAETVAAVVLPLPCVANVSIVTPFHAQSVPAAVPALPLVHHGSSQGSCNSEAVWCSVPHFANVIKQQAELPHLITSPVAAALLAACPMSTAASAILCARSSGVLT
eukprot:GHVU01143447.1.p1 GENE.GHVU01143447.1~~GHVU01143447.1.p1  ORF type:complete len:135 (+),score=1.68 GHVU01143447.1:42-407(+)